jgi:hypothetical protein
MAFRSRVRGNGLTITDLIDAVADLDPMLTGGRIDPFHQDALHVPYIALRWMNTGALARVRTLISATEDSSTALLLRALALSFIGETAESAALIEAAIQENPLDERVLFMKVRPALAALATGTAGVDVHAAAQALRGSARAVVDGWQLAAAQNWHGLEALDGELARAVPTDIWYPQAAQLRAEWRTKDRASRASARANQEARDILNDALMISPSVDLYLLRSASALNLDDMDSFVESSWHVVRHIRQKLVQSDRGEYAMSAQERALMANRLYGISRVMDALSDRIDAARGRLITSRIEQLLEEYQLMSTN